MQGQQRWQLQCGVHSLHSWGLRRQHHFWRSSCPRSYISTSTFAPSGFNRLALTCLLLIGSPFRVPARELVDPSKVRCSGPGLGNRVRAGVPQTFTVDCSRAGVAQLEVQLYGPTGEEPSSSIGCGSWTGTGNRFCPLYSLVSRLLVHSGFWSILFPCPGSLRSDTTVTLTDSGLFRCG